MTDLNKVTFPVFVAVWNKLQNMSTPTVHIRIARWLEAAWRSGKKRLLLMAFRSCGKSTLVGLFAAWLLYRKPELRIIVLAADLPLAGKMVRNVRRIIERHPLASGLKPDSADQWGTDRFTVNRNSELRDPSMLARSVTANMTGCRADIILCDDVEVPNTCDTAEKRTLLREALGEMDFILVPGGVQLYIGTPHSYYSIYADQARTEIGEDVPFLHDFERLCVPILDKAGNSAWPERYSAEDIAAMRRRAGPNRFNSQMMLQPTAVTEGYFDPASLPVYQGEVAYSEAGQRPVLTIGGKRMVSASAWWDPAFGQRDGSVLAVVYADADGTYYLHRIFYIATDPESAEDEATQQCRLVAACAGELFLPSVTLETNGIGKFLPGILRRELAAGGLSCAVREIVNSRPKEIRILESLDAVVAARALHIHDSVRHSRLMTELQEWKPGRNGRDDGIDAVAGAVSQEPVRLRRIDGGGRRPGWQGSGGTVRANSDFEV